MQNFLAANRQLWNKKTAHHLVSDFYNMPSFKVGNSSLNSIELDIMGQIEGLDLLHLQCHFGQDSLSLARLGANVSGLDLSDESIAAARQIANELGLDAQFYQGNVLEMAQILPKDQQYDVIFTSYGAIGWLPELNSWGEQIGQLLKAGGRFIIVEFHPAVWMFDDDFMHLGYSYFNKEAIVEEVEGSYSDRNTPIKGQAHCWNHSFMDVFAALHQNGKLQLQRFEEFDYSPYDCFSKTVAHPKGFQIEGMEGKLPMVYVMEWQKP